MTLNQILLWTVFLSCFSLMIRTLYSNQHRGWSLVSGSILGVTSGLFYLAPNLAGIIGGSLWAVFLLVPLVGFAKVNKLIYQERYRDARRLAAYLRWLHPADGWLEQPVILEALEMGQQGKMAQALKNLHPYEKAETPIGRNATALLFLMRARWQELLQWIQHTIPESLLIQDPYLVTYYLRALGEMGDLNDLLWTIERYERHLRKQGQPIPLHLAWLFALAFCGQTEDVGCLLGSSLSTLSPKVKTFWRLTAQMATKPNHPVPSQLGQLRDDCPNTVLNHAIAWRSRHPLANPREVLTGASWEMLWRIKTEVRQEVRYGQPFLMTPRKAHATYILIALNCLVFSLEIHLGGSTNPLTLDRMGALIPSQVWAGEIWRLVTANFLHYGVLHLLTNLIGLYILGPFVELRLGFERYCITYFGAGIGAMAAFSAIALTFGDPEQRLVGASAAIMGILGAIVAILLQGWLREKSHIAAKRLCWFLVIIALQTTFDLYIPEVSFLAHALGLGFGFTIGTLLLPNR
ncbi:rhomboid family intramembrane serine protease [Spirulina subsalsa]|uniref:rhomboid family intramembrane serine protease n=1 Tax=Spirulina subsalsa TaxID=54311 RepID=UPI00035EECEA|nr:rhomboid family intramembrane serine protease [Spirulina subsalsa]